MLDFSEGKNSGFLCLFKLGKLRHILCLVKLDPGLVLAQSALKQHGSIDKELQKDTLTFDTAHSLY